MDDSDGGGVLIFAPFSAFRPALEQSRHRLAVSPVQRWGVNGNGIGHEEEGLRILKGVYSGNGRGCGGRAFWDCRRLWILCHVIKIV